MAEQNDSASIPNESQFEREQKEEAEREAAKAALRRAQRPHKMLRRNIVPQEMIALIFGFGFLILLLVTLIQPFTHPVFPLAVLIFFLYPFRKVIVARRTMQLGIIAFLIWLFLNLSGVLFPFIMAFILAYLFAPLVSRLSDRGIPRWGTSLAIVLVILSLYAGIGVFIIPGLVEQFQQIFTSAEGFLADANSMFDRNSMINRLISYGVPPAQAQDMVVNVLEPQLKQIATWLFTRIGDFLKNITSILEGVMNLVLIPILCFYMMLDFERIRIFIRSTLLQDQPRYVYLAQQVDGILSAYIRGILITSALVGGMAIAILSIFNGISDVDVPYAVVIGILTGVFNLIPTVGIFLNLGVAMIIYLFAPGDFWMNTLITAVMVLALHALNSYLIEPRILGDRVGLPPVLLIASLFVFSHFLGFVGLLIAVPTTAVIAMFLKEWYRSTVTLRKPVTVTPNPSP